MTTYFKKSEIETSINLIASDYLQDCIKNDRLSENLVDLLKYNFSAKFVSFNIETKNIEIGVEDSQSVASHYPVINVISFPIAKKNNKWLEKSFKKQINDLVFYGKLINRKKYKHNNAEVIVM